MSDKVSGKDSGGQTQWRRFTTIGIDTAVEETQERNRRDVGRWKWRNGNGNGMGKYQQGATTNLRAYSRYNNLGVREMTKRQGNSGCIWRLCVSYCDLNKFI